MVWRAESGCTLPGRPRGGSGRVPRRHLTPGTHRMPERTLSHREIAAFFVPLVAWSLVIMTSHSIVNAALAREAQPTVVLAAYSVALALYRTINAWGLTMQQMGLAFIGDRRSVWRLAGLGQGLVGVNLAAFLALAFTPLGEAVYGGVFGASPAVVAEAKCASLWLGLIFPVELCRNLFAAVHMQRRRTGVIFVATMVRTGTLVAVLVLAHRVLDGVVLGSVAVGLGFTAEVAVLALAAWPVLRALPAVEGDPVPHGEVLRYGWPIAVNVLTENGIVLAVNLFIGQLAQPDLGLAAFGVVQALSLVFLTSLRNLTPTAQALVRGPADTRRVLVFTGRTALLGCAVFAVLFYTPLRGLVLVDVLGLEPALAAYAAPATLVFLATPPAWAFAATLRGLLAGARRTGVLAVSGVVRLAGVAGVSALILLAPETNGAVVGMVALTLGFALEAALLAHTLRRRAAADAT